MFTSRAEYRLALRADNADQRLTPKGVAVGLVSAERRQRFDQKVEGLMAAKGLLKSRVVTPHQLRSAGIPVSRDGQRRNVLQALALSETNEAQILALVPEFAAFPAEIRQQTAADALYAPYLDRQSKEIDALRRDQSATIPMEIDYSTMPGLSAELRMKLQRRRPSNLSEAGRIEGVTPAALALIMAHSRRASRSLAASKQ